MTLPMQLIDTALNAVNAVANALGLAVGGLMRTMPPWLSLTLWSVVMGIVLIVLFKYVSNQAAIGKVRDGIKADMLALKLFKDDLGVTVRSQGCVLLGALKLLACSVRPLVIMMIPVMLVLVQMARWYQVDALLPGDRAVVTVTFDDAHAGRASLANIALAPDPDLGVVTGPVRLGSVHQVCWEIQPQSTAVNHLEFIIGDRVAGKRLVVGRSSALTSISPERCGRSNILGRLLVPYERPIDADVGIKSIAVAYPRRSGWAAGSDHWVIFFFVVSMIAALAFKGVLGVRI